MKAIGDTLESQCDDIIHELHEEMREKISEAIFTTFEEADMQDNYFDEKKQEAEDAMVEYIEIHI